AGTDGATFPFWSPDSLSIGFFADGKLKRLDLQSGRPQTLADAPAARGGTWTNAGIIIFSPAGGTGLWRVPAAGGQAAALTALEAGETSHRFPQVLPGGRQLLVFVQAVLDKQGIYLASIDGSSRKRLTPADAAGACLAPGWLLFPRQTMLVAQR